MRCICGRRRNLRLRVELCVLCFVLCTLFFVLCGLCFSLLKVKRQSTKHKAQSTKIQVHFSSSSARSYAKHEVCARPHPGRLASIALHDTVRSSSHHLWVPL